VVTGRKFFTLILSTLFHKYGHVFSPVCRQGVERALPRAFERAPERPLHPASSDLRYSIYEMEH